MTQHFCDRCGITRWETMDGFDAGCRANSERVWVNQVRLRALAVLDKEFLAIDAAGGKLYMSYTEFGPSSGFSGS